MSNMLKQMLLLFLLLLLSKHAFPCLSFPSPPLSLFIPSHPSYCYSIAPSPLLPPLPLPICTLSAYSPSPSPSFYPFSLPARTPFHPFLSPLLSLSPHFPRFVFLPFYPFPSFPISPQSTFSSSPSPLSLIFPFHRPCHQCTSSFPFISSRPHACTPPTYAHALPAPYPITRPLAHGQHNNRASPYRLWWPPR